MFENKTETEARKEILDLVAEYADKFHNQKKVQTKNLLLMPLKLL